MAADPLDKLKFLANLSINRSTWLLLLLLIVCNIRATASNSSAPKQFQKIVL